MSKYYRDIISPEAINFHLMQFLLSEYNVMTEEILSQPHCDIAFDFLGFVDVYYYLSLIIPKHWTVIDFGCAFAPQAYFFRHHKKYIGIDKSDIKRFTFENTEHKIITIENELKLWKNKSVNKVFAICSYVSSNERAVREIFTNLFTYYPSGEFVGLVKSKENKK